MKPRGWIDEPLYTKIREVMPIPCVDLLVTHNNRLLLMLRNNEPGRGVWFTPGSRILYGETIEETVKRTLTEETGLTPIKIVRKGVMTHFWPETHTVTVFYRVDVEDDQVKMNEEHSAYKWISEATNDLHPFLKRMIEESKVFKKKYL